MLNTISSSQLLCCLTQSMWRGRLCCVKLRIWKVAKIDQLVYENRQHTVDSVWAQPESHPNSLTSHPTTNRNGLVNGSRKMSKRKKRVTFKRESELVSIRLISPRPNRSDSSDNELSSESSEEDDSDSDESSDSELVDHLVTNASKMMLQHTKRKVKVTSQVSKPATLRVQQLRRPRLVPPTQQKLNVSNSPGKSQSISEAPKVKLTMQNINHRGMNRLTSLRRAQSCNVDPRNRAKEANNPRATSAAASLSLSNRKLTTASASSMYSIPPQNERYSQIESLHANSGQERTKFYAWQVANGAPLVTTPGITPLCAEHVTLTKL